MKKLLALSFLFLLTALSVAIANPAPLLLQWATPRSIVLALSDADLSAITSYAANNQAALISTLVNGLDIAQDIMVMPGVKNKIPMPKLKVGNGARPYSGTQEFKVKNLKYTDRFLEVKVGKRELQIDPEDYMASYFAWINSPGSAAGKKDIPFAAFMWDQVIKGYQRELNDETAYKGFDGSATAAYNAGTVYNPGDMIKFATATDNPNGVLDWYLCITLTTAGQSPDTTAAKWQNVTARAIAPGVESYILTAIAGSEIAPVATGAITSSSGVSIAAHKKLYRSFIAPYKNAGIIISESYTDFELLLDDLSDKYKAVKDNVAANGFLVLPDTNNKCIVKPATWLGTSRRLIAGPVVPGEARHWNLYMGTDLASDANGISVKDTELWKLNAGIKSRIGFQIQDTQAIKVGDQS
jgi:hypothetical protein